jgi:hypothetical protein
MGVTATASRPRVRINLVYYVSELEREQRVAQASANSFQSLLEAETQRTQLLQGAITSVCDGLGVEPDADTGEDAPGNSFVCRMAVLARLVRERIWGSLHHAREEGTGRRSVWVRV